MDWQALVVTLKMAFGTCIILLPMALVLGRYLARYEFFGKWLIEVVIILPLILPPTVMGYYLLVVMGSDGWVGSIFEHWLGVTLVFHMEGLILASVLFNLPFAIYPIQRAFLAIEPSILEAAALCGLSQFRTFVKIEFPLIWPGLVSALILVFTHTLGEFGIILMVGGSIPGETRTLSISIYDKVQSFDFAAAHTMSLFLLLFSTIVIVCLGILTKKQYGTKDGPHLV